MTKLRKKFPEVFRTVDHSKVLPEVKHSIVHEIKLFEHPKRVRPYRLADQYHEPVKAMFDEMLEIGIVRRSASFHVSPLLVVPKKDGRLRPCVDYRNLNAATIADNYPLPRIDDMVGKIQGSVFSNIDLKDGFYHIPIREKDIEKTAVATPWGAFEYT